MQVNYYSPQEITEKCIETGVKKAGLPWTKMLLLGIIAGVFLSLAGHCTEVVAQNVRELGMARLLSAIIFPCGLVMILIAGAELFTGNCLIIISCLERKSKWMAFAKSLVLVYIGNLIGSLIVVFSFFWMNQTNHTDGMYGGYAVKIAAYKSGLAPVSAFVSGIFANLLVCLGVWLSFAAKDIAGKIMGIFYPIFLFIITGTEHVIANMYYIPMGLLAKSNNAYLEHAASLGVTPEKLSHLTLSNAIINNFIPVTFGNFVGGAIFVGFFYWLVYVRKNRKLQTAQMDSIIQFRNEYADN